MNRNFKPKRPAPRFESHRNYSEPSDKALNIAAGSIAVVLVGGVIAGTTFGVMKYEEATRGSHETAREQVGSDISDRFSFDYLGLSVTTREGTYFSDTKKTGQTCLKDSPWDIQNSQSSGDVHIRAIGSISGEKIVEITPDSNVTSETRILSLSGLRTFNTPLQPYQVEDKEILTSFGCKFENN